MNKMENAILAALKKEMVHFNVLENVIPEWVELRVCYEGSLNTLRFRGENIAAGITDFSDQEATR